MRQVWTTLVPMLVVAALVLWGGEHMARRTLERRVPADRERLFDFSVALRDELDRLDGIYARHLGDISTNSAWLSREELTKRCVNLFGVRRCAVFVSGHKAFEVLGKKPPPGETGRVPALQAEGEEEEFPSRARVVLPREILSGKRTASAWLPGPDPAHRIYWQRTEPDRIIAFVIDMEEMNACLKASFAAWQGAAFSPLRESGEWVAVDGPGGESWLGAGGEARTGPAALVVPHRTALGDWQVLAWDKLETTVTHDTTTLVLACGTAVILLLAGIYLQIQQRRAIRLAEERVSFVNRVSHELGTPLTNILLNLDLASRSMEVRPLESRRRLGLVNEEVQRLGRLVSNVLTFSRGERKTLELRNAPCIPDEVVAGVLEQFQPSLDRRKVSVDWQRGAGVNTRLDPDALAQIAGNLISNVEKYASKGGWLGIETKMENDRLRLRVSDRGPGIPMAQRERIFQAFERIQRGVSEGSSGTGLGLAIARDLARRMGGDLVIVPVSEGSAFELDLPAPPHLVVISNESVA